jgi:6-phosphogluconolactonase
MAAPELHILENSEEVAREAADFFVWIGEQAITARGVFRVALSGGSTPKALHGQLAGHHATRLDWSKASFFFGDERCVPPDHADSNFRMANETLLKPLKIAPPQIFRLRGEDDPNKAAHQYEDTLQKEFGGQAPRFDLIVLGLGDDGHTASLFPGTPALGESARLVVPNQAPQGARQRLTFTARLINQARVVAFLVCGAGKMPAVRSVLDDRAADPKKIPAKFIQPQGRLVWFLDRAAAAGLAVETQRVVSNEE